MQTINEVIHKTATGDPTGDPAVLARKLLLEIDNDLLVEMISEAIAGEQRALTRIVERTAFKAFFASPTNDIVAAQSNDSLRAIFSRTFSLGTGEAVAWGAATVDQHRQRIAMLQRMRDGIDATIYQHEEAIRVITEAGVTSLDELAVAA